MSDRVTAIGDSKQGAMRIVYVYLTDVRKNWPHIVQILQMCIALSTVHEVTLFHPFILKNPLRRRLDFFDTHVGKRFSITRMAAFGPLGNKFLDYANRIIFFPQVLVFLYFSQYDLIYSRDLSFLVFLSKIPKFMRPGKKIVYEAHNVYYFISDKIKNPRVEVDSLRLADAIIATSSGIKRDLVRMGVDEGKISVVSNGVNIDKFSIDFDRRGFRKNADISEKGPVIIYSGSWEKWKGLDVLIKAYARVSEKIADCKLILVGGSKEQIGRASKLIRDLNIDTQRIRMVSFLSQKEVVNYLKMADIGIIPTRDTIVGRRYTSPLKLFEYMAAGLAIVASDLPSIREILGEEDAVFFEPGNEHDLADKVIELISNKSKRDRLQVSVRERVSEFSYEERCRKVLETIEGII